MLTTTHLGVHHYSLMDAGDMHGLTFEHETKMRQQASQWNHFGTYNFDQFRSRLATGREDLVAESEKVLAKIEDQMPLSRGWRNIDDVVGAVPNVPAFLAGHPQCMRRRERTQKDNAPLTLFVDIGSSASIPQSMVLQRGVVLLALVRLLVSHRPVELWAGTILSDNCGSGTTAWRVDTTPMDLARAAMHVADSSTSRVFGYTMNRVAANGMNLIGYWVDYQKRFEQLKMVAGWGETVFIPKVHAQDKLISDPVGWLKNVLKIDDSMEDAA